MRRRVGLAIIITLSVLALIVIIEILFIKYNGTYVPTPNIPRQTQTLGSGPELSYVVLGDSTSVGQGADYKNSYAQVSAQHLSKKYKVTFNNVGVSGARVKDLFLDQVAKAITYKPDIVLIGVGANDTTHFTSGGEIQKWMQKTVDDLKIANPDIKIVVTRSPALDSVTRFPVGAKQLMGLRTKQVNSAFAKVIKKNDLTLAPIAEKTRDAFIADPTLTAADKFHPNDRGYVLWYPVINDALDLALNGVE